MALGRAARGTPRLAFRLLRRVRDFAATPPVVTTTDVSLTLERLAIDADSLEYLDRRYLRTLTARHGGGPAVLETLAAAIGEPADTFLDTVEPYLIQRASSSAPRKVASPPARRGLVSSTSRRRGPPD